MKFLDVPQSGSIAGTTHSHNRAGQYTRNRRSPVQPVGTGRRATVRANLGAASSGYAALTAAQQAAWASYADSHPYVDSLGQSIKLTGHQMYVAINSQLLNCGQAQSATPPTDSSVFALTAVSGAFDTVVGTFTMAYTSAGGASDFLLFAFSKQQSSGRGYCKTFWQEAVTAANAASPYDAYAGYIAQFGTPAPGQRVFYRVTPVNQYGVAGVPVIGFVTCT